MKKLFFYSVIILLVLINTNVFGAEKPAYILPINQNGTSYTVAGLQMSDIKFGYTEFVNAKTFRIEGYTVLLVRNKINSDETDAFIKSDESTVWTRISTVCDNFKNVYVDITKGAWNITFTSPICNHSFEKKLQPSEEIFVEKN